MEILSATQVREASMDCLVEEAKRHILSEIKLSAHEFIDGGVFTLQKNLKRVYPNKVVQELTRIFKDRGWILTFSIVEVGNPIYYSFAAHSVTVSEVT